MASLKEESDPEESSYSLSDNETLAPQKKRDEEEKRSGKIDMLPTYAFAEDNAAYIFAFLQ